jgi:hypothetical protein
MKLEFYQQIFENTPISNFKNIRPVGAELFHSEGQTDRQTDMTKLKLGFRNFANTPKNRRHLIPLKETRCSAFKQTEALDTGSDLRVCSIKVFHLYHTEALCCQQKSEAFNPLKLWVTLFILKLIGTNE